MKSTLLLALALILSSVSVALAAPIGIYQHGTVIRMRMGDCMLMHKGGAARGSHRFPFPEQRISSARR